MAINHYDRAISINAEDPATNIIYSALNAVYSELDEYVSISKVLAS
jgi:hypothetical protein